VTQLKVALPQGGDPERLHDWLLLKECADLHAALAATSATGRNVNGRKGILRRATVDFSPSTHARLGQSQETEPQPLYTQQPSDGDAVLNDGTIVADSCLMHRHVQYGDIVTHIRRL